MSSDKTAFDRYLLALRKTSVAEKTEHTDRAALQSLLQAVADAGASGVGVQHEPKRVADKGAPDFKVTKRGLILGYVENKTIGENLDKVLKSDQIKRYKKLVAKYHSHRLFAFHMDQQGRHPAGDAVSCN